MMRRIYKTSGSITVFMSLVMLLIMSILCVQVQAIAINTGKYMVDKAHSAAQKAVMSNYSKEIYENYHIFTVDLANEDMESRIMNYVEASINPGSEFDGKSYNSVNLTGMDYLDVTEIEFENITGQDGQLFIDQVVQYMKYHLGDNFSKEYLKKFEPLNKTDNVLEVVEKKQEIYDKALDVSSDVLKLMSYVDGIAVGRGNVIYDARGCIKLEKYYAKILVSDNGRKEDLGINNEALYILLKDRCYVLGEEIGTLENEYWEYVSAIGDDNAQRSKKKKICQNHQKELIKLIEGSISSYEKALNVIDDIYKGTSKYDEAKKEFGVYLESVKNEIPKDVYDELKQENQIQENQSILEQLPKIREELTKNLVVLEELKNLEKLSFTKEKEDLEEGKKLLTNAVKKSKNYSVKDIGFDYKGLKVKEDKSSFFGSVKNTLNNGIVGLVASEDKLSRNRLEDAWLPSGNISGENSGGIGGVIVNGVTSGIDEAISGFSNITTLMSQGFSGVTKMLEQGSDDVIDKIFLCEYINQHFNAYGMIGSNVNAELEHALEYEKEYIICGNSTDMANLKSIINKVVTIRTVCNFISIFTDANKNAQAMEVASLAFGFTGVTAIVEAAKIIVMFMWAYEEALVDMCALLQGSSVPLIKTGTQIILSIEELPLLSKTLINEKASSYKGVSISSAVDYDFYLNLFLFMSDESKLAYRCMDLIQGNINKSYNQKINLNKCAYGVSSTVNVVFDMRYVAFGFMEEMIPDISQIRGYSSNKAYCY